MPNPPTIQVNGTSVKVCSDVTAGDTVTITVTQDGSSTTVYQNSTSYPATRRECHTFTLGNGTYEVRVKVGDETYDYTITVPNNPSTPTPMNPSSNNPP